MINLYKKIINILSFNYYNEVYNNDSNDNSNLRYIFFIPLFGIGVFICTVLIVLYVLYNSAREQQNYLLSRDLPWLNNKIYNYAKGNEQELKAIIHSVKPFFYDKIALQEQLKQFMQEHAEVIAIYRLNSQHQVLWSWPNIMSIDLYDAFNGYNDTPITSIIYNANLSKDKKQSIYFNLETSNKNSYIFLQMPLIQDSDFIGSLAIVYSPTKLITNCCNDELTKNYHITLQDANKNKWFESSGEILQNRGDSYKIPLRLVNQYTLIGVPYKYANNFLQNALIWMIIILSGFIIFSLYMLWKYMLQIDKTQRLLFKEIAFRKTMGDSILVGMRAIDTKGKIIYVNPAFCNMTGFNEKELLGTIAPFLYWPKNDYQALFSSLNDSLRGNYSDEGSEFKFIKKDGSTFYARTHASKLTDGNGKPIGWLNSIIDVTEQKKAREELASAHKRFMKVVESLETGVSVLLLENSELLFCNHYYIQIFGKSNQAHLYLSQSTHPINLNVNALDWLEKVMPQLNIDNKYEEMYYPDNKKWFNIKTYPIEWVDGRIAQMMISIDITETKLAQEQARINEEKWHFANRLSNMGEMASSIAHEINQPLTAISNYCIGMIEMAKKEKWPIKDSAFKVLEKVSYQAIKAGKIVSRIKGFISKNHPKKQLEDIEVLAQEAISLINFSNRHSSIRIKVYIQNNLPKLFIDKVLIEQVLVNLLKNAIESNAIYNQVHNVSSTSYVTLKIFPLDKIVNIHVIDEGIGINNAIQDKIFDAFFSTKQQGMGMGLNICRSIIEKHQGVLSVENNANKGCTFKVTLPIEF